MPAEQLFPAKLVFVGGAPRSGTTITHALVCTAPGASPYTPEISFFSFIMKAYWAGLANWSIHTHGFYPDQDAFRAEMAEAARGLFRHIWRRLGEPEILCLKDPMLTPHFPDLNRLLPEAQFLTVCRHPYDVVRSRQEVHEQGGRGPFGEEEVRQVAEEYAQYYHAVMTHTFAGKQLMVRYEDLGKPTLRKILAGWLGVTGFDDERLWLTASGEKRDSEASKADPTHSPKYSGPLDLSPRLDSLRPEWRAIVAPICEPVMTPMQYG